MSETTYGQRAVGLNFNPSGNHDVENVKEMFSLIIDLMNDMREKTPGERARLCSVAITEAQTAQMWVVKAITYQE